MTNTKNHVYSTSERAKNKTEDHADNVKYFGNIANWLLCVTWRSQCEIPCV